MTDMQIMFLVGGCAVAGALILGVVLALVAYLGRYLDDLVSYDD